MVAVFLILSLASLYVALAMVAAAKGSGDWTQWMLASAFAALFLASGYLAGVLACGPAACCP